MGFTVPKVGRDIKPNLFYVFSDVPSKNYISQFPLKGLKCV